MSPPQPQIHIAHATPSLDQEDIKHMDHDLQVENAEGGGLNKVKVPLEDFIEYSPEEEKKLVRKCDFVLIPVMACSTAFSYLDKIAIGNAATLTFKSDLGLHGNQYALLTTVYYVAFIAAQWPANMALQKFNTGRVMSISMLLWGIVTLGSFAVQTFGQMAALRFLLAVFEACIVPGLILTTAAFYKPVEIPSRTSLWTLANTLLPIPFSVIYFGFASLSSHPLAQWRYIYILLGCLTIALSICVFFVIPDQPATCWWLTERQRQILVQRTAVSRIEKKNHDFKRAQMWEALTDIKAWLMVLAMACQQSGQSVIANFSGQLITGLGFSGLHAMILQIPGWICACGMILTTGFLGTYVKFFHTRKLLIMMVSCALAVAGLAVLVRYPPGSGANQGMQLFCLCLLQGHGGAYSGLVALAGQNFSGSTKRTFVLSMTFAGFALSNMLVPLSFLDKESPVFLTGLITVMCMLAACFITYVLFYVAAQHENARRDRLAIEQPADQDPNVLLDEDLTDKENLRFRYSS